VTTILALNPGSSSLKASVRNPNLLLTCTIQRLGSAAGTITLTVGDDHHEDSFTGGLDGAIELIARQCRERGIVIDAVAHRVVHGGPLHHQPTFVDDELIGDLQRAVPLAPLHLPGDIDTIEHARSVWPHARHVACFDTGFHHDLPEQATRLPVSTELAEQGVRRYGFHGLSIQSALHAHPEIDQAVIAHLGSGCSVTAVAGGKSRHTTMSLTPTGGMVSATRTGDLDPEIVLYLIQQHGHTVDELRQLLDRHAGLAGLAGGRRTRSRAT
jgi:acetate kinase